MTAPSRRFGLSALTLAVAALLAGCGGQPAAQQAPPAPSVTVAPVSQKEIVEWRDFTGHTEPVESVEIRPRA